MPLSVQSAARELIDSTRTKDCSLSLLWPNLNVAVPLNFSDKTVVPNLNLYFLSMNTFL